MRTFTASTLAFLLVLAPTVPAMADSGGDIVFGACRPRPPRLVPRTRKNWRSRPKRRRRTRKTADRQFFHPRLHTG